MFDGPGNKKLASVLSDAYAAGTLYPTPCLTCTMLVRTLPPVHLLFYLFVKSTANPTFTLNKCEPPFRFYCVGGSAKV